jgi:hypothetical protein
MLAEFNNSRITHSTIERQRCVSEGKIYRFDLLKLMQDIVLTNEYWRMAINLDVTAHQDGISAVREDLLLVETQTKEFTAFSKLKQTETLLQTSESELHNFQQILPRLHPRQGIIYFLGTCLEVLI